MRIKVLPLINKYMSWHLGYDREIKQSKAPKVLIVMNVLLSLLTCLSSTTKFTFKTFPFLSKEELLVKSVKENLLRSLLFGEASDEMLHFILNLSVYSSYWGICDICYVACLFLRSIVCNEWAWFESKFIKVFYS